MGSQLTDVVGILDMDGFMLKKRFYCKELGLIKLGDAVGRSVFFDIGVRCDDLSPKDKKTCEFTMQKIHKLPFGVPCSVKANEISELGDIISSFYKQVKRSESSVLAYKGGHIERDLMAKLPILAINLKWFGCPKAGELVGDLICLETCGNHTVLNAYAHCAKVEVEAFGQWVQTALERQYLIVYLVIVYLVIVY